MLLVLVKQRQYRYYGHPKATISCPHQFASPWVFGSIHPKACLHLQVIHLEHCPINLKACRPRGSSKEANQSSAVQAAAQAQALGHEAAGGIV
jgi:hypothetical protein